MGFWYPHCLTIIWQFHLDRVHICMYFRKLQQYQVSYFHIGSTSLHSHQKWKSTPLIPHAHQHVSSFVVLILTILRGVRWNHLVVLICMSLMSKNIEHLFLSHLSFFYQELYVWVHTPFLISLFVFMICKGFVCWLLLFFIYFWIFGSSRY